MKPDPRHDREDRDIATLIRTAGPRPTVPQERMERARAAAAETWRRETRARTRRRRLFVAVPLAAAAALALAFALRLLSIPGADGVTAPTGGLRVEATSGTLEVTPSTGASFVAAVAQYLPPGSELVTDPRSRAILRGIASGHSVRLDRDSRVQVLGGGVLDLQAGAVYVDSGHDGSVRGMTVRTPFGDIEEIGTQFEVRLEGDSLKVRLREGAVVLHADGVSHPVATGTELTLSADGSTRVRPLLPFDAAWDWVAGIPSRYELDGRTAQSFLEDVARERGLKLAYADAPTASRAEETVLSGVLVGVSVGEALETVLPTCRLRHRVDAGVLVIEPASE